MGGAARSPLLGIVLGVLMFGCGGGGEGDDSDSSRTQAVTFQANAGAKGQKILDLGGLTLKGYCQRQAGQIDLTVTATTATDDAILGSRFSHRSSPYTFVLDNLDRSFGEYDLMGKASDETAGTLSYMPSEGGQVVVDYAAAEDTSQGDCALGGVATYAPD